MKHLNQFHPQKGFECEIIDNEQICVDINECLAADACSADLVCVNSDGSFECQEAPPCDIQKRLNAYCAQMSTDTEDSNYCGNAVPGKLELSQEFYLDRIGSPV